MTKKIICAVVLMILTFTIFALAGCEKEEVDKGLSVGFDNNGGGGGPWPSDFARINLKYRNLISIT